MDGCAGKPRMGSSGVLLAQEREGIQLSGTLTPHFLSLLGAASIKQDFLSKQSSLCFTAGEGGALTLEIIYLILGQRSGRFG